MPSKWRLKVSYAVTLAAACNGLAGIDERETAQASGGQAGAIASGGKSGRGGSGESGTPGAATDSGDGTSANAGTDAGMSGAGGDGGSIHGGASSSAGAKATGGTRSSTGGTGASTGGKGGNASTGGKGGNASTGGKGGNASTGGKSGNTSTGGEAGAGGSTSTGPCLGFANELDPTGWYINTGGAMIEPHTTEQAGLFRNPEDCARVTGTRASYAELFFQKVVHFNTLELKLISSPDLAIPTIYVHTTDDKKHCLVLSAEETDDVYAGKPLQLRSDRFVNATDCKMPDPDLEPDSVIDAISLQFDTYEPQGRTKFDLCVLKLTVH
jgi:hypothetical protein